MKDFSSLKKTPHYPVMVEKVMEICRPEKGGIFVDCTFGAGGYSKAILSFPNTKVIALDRDDYTRKYAKVIKEKYKNRFAFHNLKFSELYDIIPKNTKIDSVIFDLGLSSLQISDLKRGFSFNSKGRADMRMGLNSVSAQEVLNNGAFKTLRDIFKFFGEEKEAYNIALNITKCRKKKIIKSIP